MVFGGVNGVGTNSIGLKLLKIRNIPLAGRSIGQWICITGLTVGESRRTITSKILFEALVRLVEAAVEQGERSEERRGKGGGLRW